MIDIDPDIEKQISLIQEEKLNSKIKEDIKKVVNVVEKPEEKLVDFFSLIAKEKKQTKEKIIKSEKKVTIKKINSKEGDSLEVDQVILEFD